MKNKEIFGLKNVEGIEKLKFLTFKKSIDTVKFAREFKKVVEKFNVLNEEFNVLRNSMIEKFGTKSEGEDGGYYLDPTSPHMEEFQKTIDEFGEEELELEIKKFKVEDIDDSVYVTKEDLKDKKLNVIDFLGLHIFFEEEV